MIYIIKALELQAKAKYGYFCKNTLHTWQKNLNPIRK
jgi:hypothetical protein